MRVVFIMYIFCIKYFFSSLWSVDLSIGFDRARERRQRKLATNKTVREKDYVRYMLSNVFVSEEMQKNATCNLRYTLKLKLIQDGALINWGCIRS